MDLVRRPRLHRGLEVGAQPLLERDGAHARRGGDDVVERQVVRQVQPLQRREGDAARLAHRQAGVGEQLAQLVGSDEVVPVVRAARDHAERLGRADQQQARAGVRLGVESTISPPGARCLRQLGDEGGLVGDMLEHFHAGDEVECAEAERAPARLPCSRWRGPTPAAERRRRDVSAAASTPVTSAPSRASGSHSSPAPQPTSSARLPASGLTLSTSPPQCRSIASRRKPSRTGLSRWSIAEQPLGSHQSFASAPKCAASSGRMVALRQLHRSCAAPNSARNSRPAGAQFAWPAS